MEQQNKIVVTNYTGEYEYTFCGISVIKKRYTYREAEITFLYKNNEWKCGFGFDFGNNTKVYSFETAYIYLYNIDREKHKNLKDEVPFYLFGEEENGKKTKDKILVSKHSNHAIFEEIIRFISEEIRKECGKERCFRLFTVLTDKERYITNISSYINHLSIFDDISL